MRLGHGVQSTTVLEPFNLGLVESVRELNLEGLSVLGVDSHRQRLANCEFGN